MSENIKVDLVCPSCSCLVSGSTNRLIKEYCGHIKCRQCLLKETEGCNECRRQVDKNRIVNASVVEVQNYSQLVEDNEEDDDESGGSDALQIDTSLSEEDDDELRPVAVRVKKPRNKFKESHIVKKACNGDPGNTLYECTKCGKSFKSRANKQYHMFCGSDERPLKCDKCDKTFVSKFHLNYHRATHVDNQQSHQCDVCGRKFLRKPSLMKHQRQHNKSALLTCEICGAFFISEKNLANHKLKHEAFGPFKCDRCDREFKLKSNLKSHQITHTRRKRFSCEVCGKKFPRRNALKLHSLTHSSERPFECHQCHKTFADKRAYDRHLRVHSTRGKFSCPVCDTKCSRKDLFRRHVKNLHPGQKFEEIFKRLVEKSDETEPVIVEKEIVILKSPSPPETKLGEDDRKRIENEKNTSLLEKLRTDILERIPQDGPNTVNVIKCIGNVKPKIPVVAIRSPPRNHCPPVESPKRINFNLQNNVSISTPSTTVTTSVQSVNPTMPIVAPRRPKKVFNPIDIYRKILLPNDEDDDDEVDNHLEEEEDHQSSTTKDDGGLGDNQNSSSNEQLYIPPKPIDFSEIHWRKRTSQFFVGK